MADRDVVRGVAVYEIDGRLLLRTVDRSGGLGVERDDIEVLDDWARCSPADLGAALLSVAGRSLEVPWPDMSRPRREYARPLLAASPGRYSSYRSWQRAARHVGAEGDAEQWTLYRWHPELGSGSWGPAADAHRPVGDLPQQIELPPDASAEALGRALLDLLAQPSLRDG